MGVCIGFSEHTQTVQPLPWMPTAGWLLPFIMLHLTQAPTLPLTDAPNNIRISILRLLTWSMKLLITRWKVQPL